MKNAVYWGQSVSGIALALLAQSTLAATCNVSTTSVAFGSYSSTLNSTSTGAVTIDCDGAASYNIQLSCGGGTGCTPRQLSDGASHTLNYNLYTTGSYGTVWDLGSGGMGPVGGSVNSNPYDATHTVYGVIPSGQNGYVGTYSDTVQVTVNY